jgi:hydrogenase maturation factor HypF (carbamoyltransferase family)
MVDKILIKWPRLTTAQVILCLVLFIAIWLGFLTTDIQYNRQISIANQKSILELVTNAIEAQNRTREFMPQFLASIHDTHRVAELMPNLTSAVNNVSRTTLFLSNNFGADSNYLNRENFQYHQANASFAIVNNTLSKLLQGQHQLQSLIIGLNKSLSQTGR